MTASPVSAQVMDGFDALPGLRDAWERLFLSRPNEPSTSFEWTCALARHHVKSDDRCLLVQLRRGDVLVGLVPLVLRQMRILGQRVGLLAPLSEDYNTHSDLLLESTDDDTVSALVTVLYRLGVEWDCFRMARLLEANPLVPALERALTTAGRLHRRREGLPAYALQLPRSFDQYLAARSAKFRSHLKRTIRKLQDAGDVRVLELNTADTFDQAYDALLQVERSSWKQAHGTAITAVDRQTGFYRDLARDAFARGRLHLQWLTLDAQPVAYNLGCVTSNGYHYLKTSYDARVRSLGAPTVLRARLIESLIAAGVAHFDFPGEPYEWEAQWAETLRWRTVMSLYPSTVRGHALAALDRVRHHRRDSRRLQHVDSRAHGRRREGWA